MEDGKDSDGGWRGRWWRMERALMEDGKNNDGGWRAPNQREQSGVEYDRGLRLCHSLNPEESSLRFNAVLHQQISFMSLQHSCIIRLEKGIKDE